MQLRNTPLHEVAGWWQGMEAGGDNAQEAEEAARRLGAVMGLLWDKFITDWKQDLNLEDLPEGFVSLRTHGVARMCEHLLIGTWPYLVLCGGNHLFIFLITFISAALAGGADVNLVGTDLGLHDGYDNCICDHAEWLQLLPRGGLWGQPRGAEVAAGRASLERLVWRLEHALDEERPGASTPMRAGEEKGAGCRCRWRVTSPGVAYFGDVRVRRCFSGRSPAMLGVSCRAFAPLTPVFPVDSYTCALALHIASCPQTRLTPAGIAVMRGNFMALHLLQQNEADNLEESDDVSAECLRVRCATTRCFVYACV